MNIWLLTTEYPPDFGGGIGTYTVNAARMLARAGHDVTVLALGRAAGVVYEPFGARVMRIAPPNLALSLVRRYLRRAEAHDAFPYNVMSYWPALSYQFAQAVRAYVEQGGRPPDVIECQDYAALAYYLLQNRLLGAAWLANSAVLVHAHSPMFELDRVNEAPRYKFPDYWTGQMEKFCFLAADGVLSPSQYLANRLQQTLGQPLPITVIPLPYAPGERLPSHPMPGDVLYVGRLEVRKGVLPLVQTCARLWASGADFRLTMVGSDTPYYPRATTVHRFLQGAYAREIEAGKLAILGDSLPPDELQQRLAQAWTVIVPSLWENYPFTCIEAMASGKVVVASTDGGQAEMITGAGDGFVFDWQRAGDFERALCQALTLRHEENLAIGQHAAARIDSLTSYEAVLPQRERHYRAVIERASVPRRQFPSLRRQPAPAMPRGADEIAGRVSVVIPFYNLGQYIEATVQNVLHADYPDVEIVIVNDGSTDPASLAALRRIDQAQHAQLRIISTDNQGAAQARNTGAAAASGEFLVFLDADDLVAPDFFRRALVVLERYSNVGFVYSWARFFDGNTSIWPTWNADVPFLLGHNMVPVSGVIRRGLFLRYGQYRSALSHNLEDYDSWLSVVQSGALGVSIPEPLYHYRIRSDGRLQSIHEDQALYLYDLIVQQHRELYAEYGGELFQLQNANGPSYLWQHPALHYRPSVKQFSISTAANEHMRIVALRRLLWSGWTHWMRMRARLRRLWR